MKEFYTEVSEKKQMAIGAKHKVNGVRSRACHLPSDDMSKKELRSLNGEVKTYHLKKPMKWAEFTAMPRDLQKLYIEKLIDRYGVSNKRLAAMFGVSGASVSVHLTSLGIRRGHTTMTTAQIEAWEKFEVSE